jgi:hypothetical protein
MLISRLLALPTLCLLLVACVQEPAPTPPFQKLQSDLASFSGLGPVSVTAIDTDQYRSHFRATIRHGGIAQKDAYDALEHYLASQAPWFVFQRETSYWFVHPIGGRRYHFDIMLNHGPKNVVLDIRQSFAK